MNIYNVLLPTNCTTNFIYQRRVFKHVSTLCYSHF